MEVPVLKQSQSIAILALSVALCAAFGQASMSEENNKPDKPVTGLPFTADQRIRTIQHLANGITLTHEMRGRIYRSSTGLERSEATMVTTDSASKPPITMVWIVDRSQHTVLCLHVQSKFATVTHVPPNRTVTVGFLDLPPFMKPESLQPGKPETTDLGRRTYEGLEVAGKRVTRTIDSDQAGNDAPFQSIREQWVYPQLNLIVEEIERNPEYGEREVELTNIRAEEPDPGLFKIPEGTQMMDQP
jgi:hypothetical protein